MKRQPLSPEAQRIWEAPLPPEEFERRLALILADEEQLERTAELCRWFQRRYPTARERLAYARRKYAEWTQPCEIVPRNPDEK
jgi:hypothetical protein